MNKSLVALLWSALGLACGALLLQARHLQQTRDDSLSRQSVLNQAIAQEQAAVSRLGQLVEGVEADLAEVRATLTPTVDATSASTGVSLSPMERHAQMRKDPTYQLAELELRRAELRLKYGAFYQRLKLEPQQIAGFEAAEAKHEEEKEDFLAAAKEQGLPPDDRSLWPLWEKIARERHEAHQKYLGAQGAKAWRTFDRTRQARNLIEGTAGAAALAGAPLNQTQAEALVDAMAPSDPKKYVNISRIDWATVDARARSILSPEQFRIYQSVSPVEGQSRHLPLVGVALKNALAAEAGRTPDTVAATAP